MAANSVMQLVNERGWRRGLGSMLGSELSRWWKTRMWWVQCLIWICIHILLGAILFLSPGKPSSMEVAMVFGIFGGLFPAAGVVIIMQGTIVGEKKSGTAAWVLSKPITRHSFILSKVIANSIGVLVTMIIVPGVIVFTVQALAINNPWTLPGFLAGLSVIFLFGFFFLSLTLMLGTLFSSRGPILGIALGLLFLQQYLVDGVSFLRYVLPWNLLVTVGKDMNAVMPCLLIGSDNYSPILILVTALESLVFLGIGLWRFSREEF